MVNFTEDENNITVKAKLPGFAPEDIDISDYFNILTLRGEKRQTEKTEDKGYITSKAATAHSNDR